MLIRICVLLIGVLCVASSSVAQPLAESAPFARHTLSVQIGPRYVAEYDPQLSDLAYDGFMSSYVVRYQHPFSERLKGEGTLDVAHGTLGQSPIQLGQALRVQPSRDGVWAGLGYRAAYRFWGGAGPESVKLYGGLWTQFNAAFVQHQYAVGAQSDLSRYTGLVGLSADLRYPFSPTLSAGADLQVPLASFVGQSRFASSAWERFGFDGTLLSSKLAGSEMAFSMQFQPSNFGFESRYAVQYIRLGSPIVLERLTHTFSLVVLYTL